MTKITTGFSGAPYAPEPPPEHPIISPKSPFTDSSSTVQTPIDQPKPFDLISQPQTPVSEGDPNYNMPVGKPEEEQNYNMPVGKPEVQETPYDEEISGLINTGDENAVMNKINDVTEAQSELQAVTDEYNKFQEDHKIYIDNLNSAIKDYNDGKISLDLLADVVQEYEAHFGPMIDKLNAAAMKFNGAIAEIPMLNTILGRAGVETLLPDLSAVSLSSLPRDLSEAIKNTPPLSIFIDFDFKTRQPAIHVDTGAIKPAVSDYIQKMQVIQRDQLIERYLNDITSSALDYGAGRISLEMFESVQTACKEHLNKLFQQQ